MNKTLVKNIFLKGLTAVTAIGLTVGIILPTTSNLFVLAEESSSSQPTVSIVDNIDDIEANAPTGDNTTVALDDTAYSSASVASVSDYSGYFAGGSGTSTDPYKISTAYQFCCIGKLSTEMVSTYVYYELTTDIYLSDVTFSADGYLSTYFRGSINGNKKTIYSNTSNYVWLSAYSVGTVDIYDINFYQNEGGFVGMVMYSGYYISAEDVYDNIVTFSEISIGGSFTANNNLATLTAITFGTLIFDSVTNSADITMTGYAGIFLGGYPYKAEVAYVDCVNTGKIYGVYAGFFNGNTNSDASSFKFVGSYSSNDDITDYVEYLTSVRENDTASVYSNYSIAYVKGCINDGAFHGSSSSAAFAENINKTLNAEINELILDVDEYGKKPFTANKPLSDNSTILSNVTAKISGDSVVFGNTLSVFKTYTVDIYVSTSFLKETTLEDGSIANVSVGSSYAMLTITLDSTMSVDNIERIMGSDEWDAANPGNTYENLVDAGYKTANDNYGGNEYIIVGNTIVVNSDSMIEIFNTNTVTSATIVTCNAAPSYRISCYLGDLLYGSKTFTYSEILAASNN